MSCVIGRSDIILLDDYIMLCVIGRCDIILLDDYIMLFVIGRWDSLDGVLLYMYAEDSAGISTNRSCVRGHGHQVLRTLLLHQ